MEFFTTNSLPSEKCCIVHGDGLIITDEVGKQYIDLSSATLNMALGHRYPTITKAVSKQMEKVWFVSTNFQNPAYYELGELLTRVAPEGMTAVNLRSCNGADAVDNAVKIAKLYTLRKKILCPPFGWHGESLTSLSLSSSYPDHHRLKSLSDVLFSQESTLESLIDLIKSNQNAAAVLLDPVGTSHGLFEPSTLQNLLKEIKDLCNKFGIILIFDEIQTFGGYMGHHLFASSYYDVVPDIICIGKAFGAGIAQSATLCRTHLKAVLCKKEGEFTFGGQPLGCTAAIQAIKSFLEISDTVSANLAAFTEAVDSLRASFPMIRFKQIGFFVSITPKEGCVDNWTKRIHFLGLEKGLLLRYNHGKCVLLKPPVIITPDLISKSKKILEEIFSIACKESMQPSMYYEDHLKNGLPLTYLTRIRKRPPVLSELKEIQALLTAVSPSLSIKTRSVYEEVKYVKLLKRNGISALEIATSPEGYIEYLHQPGTRLNDFLANETNACFINSVILLHQRFVEVAHNANFSIANRSPSNALVTGVARGLMLVNFEFEFVGDKEVLFAFEEVYSVFQCLGLVQDTSVQEDLGKRLCYALVERHGALAVSVWKSVTKFHGGTLPAQSSYEKVVKVLDKYLFIE